MAMDQTYSEAMGSLAERFLERLNDGNVPANIEIVEVKTKHELKVFVDFPLKLYEGDSNFVFEPFNLQREFLTSKNPFFNHSSAMLFLAKFQGIVVGRIASINNAVHNKVYNERTGFFGFFECIKNYEVAKALLGVVKELHLNSGFSRIIGPTNFTTNDSAGFLINGFDSPPVIMMPYNKPYYDEYITRYGFSKEIDLFSYFIDDTFLGSEQIRLTTERFIKRLASFGINFRNVDFKNYDDDLRKICPVYNESNKDNWGFIPLTEQELIYTGHQFKEFMPSDMVILATKEEEVIGFVVALPDLNQAFRKIPSGRLWPFGFIKYLRYKRKIDSSRILILGVKGCYRKSGIDLVLYKKIQEGLAKHGIYKGEACYVMENNEAMHSIMGKLGARKIKQYRMYSFDL